MNTFNYLHWARIPTVTEAFLHEKITSLFDGSENKNNLEIIKLLIDNFVFNKEFNGFTLLVVNAFSMTKGTSTFLFYPCLISLNVLHFLCNYLLIWFCMIQRSLISTGFPYFYDTSPCHNEKFTAFLCNTCVIATFVSWYCEAYVVEPIQDIPIVVTYHRIFIYIKLYCLAIKLVVFEQLVILNFIFRVLCRLL